MAGETARISFANAQATFIHFYLPESLLVTCIEETTPHRTRASIELLDPMNGFDPAIARLAQAAAHQMQTGSVSSRLEVEATGLHLAARLLERYTNMRDTAQLARYASKAKRFTAALTRGQMAVVCDAMMASIEDPGEKEAGLVELAALIGLTPSHFCRAFARTAEMPQHRWFLERRIERAALLLADRSLSLAHVAAALGYVSQSAFGRAFRTRTGMTPSAWRRNVIR